MILFADLSGSLSTPVFPKVYALPVNLFAWFVQGVESIPEESAEPAACPPVPDSPIARKASGLMGGLQRQGSKFWMISLPSLPVEGALTADPYSRVGASLERKEGAPPVKAPL